MNNNYDSELNELLMEFETVSLDEIDQIALLKRIDRKFIFHKNKLVDLLQMIQPDFKILEIQKNRIHQYQTIYYDTEHSKMYLDHHNQKSNRFKIRLRKYIDTSTTFLEIKFKNNKNITSKQRKQIFSEYDTEKIKTERFIEKNTPYRFSDLNEALTTTFFRITFIDKAMTQRFTIDIGLSYSYENVFKYYDTLVIAELKQANYNNSSVLFQALKTLRIYPQRISKYCIGNAVFNKELKQNNFKETIRKIDTLCNDNCS